MGKKSNGRITIEAFREAALHVFILVQRKTRDEPITMITPGRGHIDDVRRQIALEYWIERRPVEIKAQGANAFDVLTGTAPAVRNVDSDKHSSAELIEPLKLRFMIS